MFNSISRTPDVDEMMPVPFPREVIVMRDLTIQPLFKFIEIIGKFKLHGYFKNFKLLNFANLC